MVASAHAQSFWLVITVGNTFPLVITVENTVPLLTTVGKNNGSSFYLKKCGTSEISSMGHRRKGNCGGLFIYLIANNLKFNRTNFDYRFPSLILIINLSKHNEVKLFILLHYCTWEDLLLIGHRAEAVVQRCSVKKVLLKISQNS